MGMQWAFVSGLKATSDSLPWQPEYSKIGMHGRHTTFFTLTWFQASVLKALGYLGEVKGGKPPSHSVMDAGPGVGDNNVLWRRTNKLSYFVFLFLSLLFLTLSASGSGGACWVFRDSEI